MYEMVLCTLAVLVAVVIMFIHTANHWQREVPWLLKLITLMNWKRVSLSISSVREVCLEQNRQHGRQSQ